MRNLASKKKMSAESAKVLKATLDDCGGSTEWIWEQEDDLWGLIRLKKTNKILTVDWGSWNLDLRDLYPESTRNSQRWRRLGNLMVSNHRATTVLTAGDDGVIKLAYKSKDDAASQGWEMVATEDVPLSPSEPPPKGNLLLLMRMLISRVEE